MKKNLLLTLFASALILGACGEESAVTTTEDTDTAADEEAQTEETTEETESEVGTRSNPVSLGETATQDFYYFDEDGENEFNGNRSIKVSNPVRGEEVYNYLMEANEFNEEAPEGMEWMMVDVKYDINSSDTEDVPFYVMVDFKVIDSSGSEVSQDSVYPTLADGDAFGDVDLYAGGTAEGKYVFYVPEGDEALLEYDDWNNPSIFFSLN